MAEADDGGGATTAPPSNAHRTDWSNISAENVTQGHQHTQGWWDRTINGDDGQYDKVKQAMQAAHPEKFTGKIDAYKRVAASLRSTQTQVKTAIDAFAAHWTDDNGVKAKQRLQQLHDTAGTLAGTCDKMVNGLTIWHTALQKCKDDYGHDMSFGQGWDDAWTPSVQNDAANAYNHLIDEFNRGQGEFPHEVQFVLNGSETNFGLDDRHHAAGGGSPSGGPSPSGVGSPSHVNGPKPLPHITTPNPHQPGPNDPINHPGPNDPTHPITVGDPTPHPVGTGTDPVGAGAYGGSGYGDGSGLSSGASLAGFDGAGMGSGLGGAGLGGGLDGAGLGAGGAGAGIGAGAGTAGLGAGAGGAGAAAAGRGMMAPMMGGHGGAGGEEEERERGTWLTEDDDVWGTEDAPKGVI